MRKLLLLKPKSGVFLGDGVFVESRKDLSMTLDVTDQSSDIRLLKLNIKNVGKESVILNSLMVAEYEIPNIYIDEVLNNGWGQSSYSGYKKIHDYTKRSRFFLRRDQNPHSFLLSYGYLDKSVVNEWYTQLVTGSESVVIGAVSVKNQFTQVYVRAEGHKLRIRVTCQHDGLLLKPGEEVASETIAIVFGSKKGSLDRFADLLNVLNGVSLSFDPPSGLCCAYYHQGNKVDEKYILEQLDAIDNIPGKLGLDYVQIDAGYSPWGDWLDTKDQFPSGMKFIVDEIKKRGLKAGIWIAPFVASPSSKIFKKHNEWFLKDSLGNDFEARYTSPIDFLSALSFRVLDVTRPDVQSYLDKVIRQFVRWGFELIKVDFTYPVGFCTNYYKPMTRVQAIRKGFGTIRKAAGSHVHIMSGISQLSPLVGLVDSVRVGLDTTNPFVYNIPVINRHVNSWMLQQNLRNSRARQFLNGKVWVNDVDCLVFKSNSGLSTQDLDEHYQYVKTYGGSKWIGDHMGKLKWEIYEKYILQLFGYTKNEKIAVSVVIPAYNEEKTIVGTMLSLMRQVTKVPFEVVVVDNNCSDKTIEIVSTFKGKIDGLKVVSETKQSIGAARERGFSVALSEIVASTDADTEVPPDWVANIFGEFWINKNLVGLVGTYVFSSKSSFFNFLAKTFIILSDCLHRILVGSFAFRGSNFAVYKGMWRKAGGFNIRISALEDVDLSLRVGTLGKIGYLPNLTVFSSYRRFEGRFVKQLFKRIGAYYSRVVTKDVERFVDWESVR